MRREVTREVESYGVDWNRIDYPQPQCPVCGKFARKGYSAWLLDCLTPTGREWFHN